MEGLRAAVSIPYRSGQGWLLIRAASSMGEGVLWLSNLPPRHPYPLAPGPAAVVAEIRCPAAPLPLAWPRALVEVGVKGRSMQAAPLQSGYPTPSVRMERSLLPLAGPTSSPFHEGPWGSVEIGGPGQGRLLGAVEGPGPPMLEGYTLFQRYTCCCSRPRSCKASA
jgi:hypothetical protein